jgi:hypothetical protein
MWQLPLRMLPKPSRRSGVGASFVDWNVSRAVPLDFAAVASSLRRSAIALCRK